MASLDPVLDLLPRAPLAGLDVNAVQRERKNYWERLYEKYEQSSELDQEEIPVDELDDPATLKRLPGLQCELPTTRAFRRYIKQQGGLLDELTTIAGPPALDEEELSSGDDQSDEENENSGGGEDEGDVEVGLSGLDMSEKEQPVDGRSRSLGGKRSGDERSNNEFETEEEEEEDFSSPPAKVVTPSKRRVVVEYYTSEEEAESSVADQSCSPTIHGGQRGASDDDEQTLLCLECGAIGDVLEEGGDSAEFTCDECLMKVHPECDDPGCAVCRETAAVVEARWIMRSRLETAAQDSGEEEWVTGVEGDSVSQSSDGTEQEPEYCDQTGRGGDRNFSTIGGARGGDCESPEEGENYKETSGLDSTGDRSVYVIDSTDDDSVEVGRETDELDSSSERKVADSTGEVSDGGDCSRVSMQNAGPPRPHLRHMAQRGPIIMEDSWEERTSSDEEGNDSMSTVF